MLENSEVKFCNQLQTASVSEVNNISNVNALMSALETHVPSVKSYWINHLNHRNKSSQYFDNLVNIDTRHNNNLILNQSNVNVDLLTFEMLSKQTLDYEMIFYYINIMITRLYAIHALDLLTTQGASSEVTKSMSYVFQQLSNDNLPLVDQETVETVVKFLTNFIDDRAHVKCDEVITATIRRFLTGRSKPSCLIATYYIITRLFLSIHEKEQDVINKNLLETLIRAINEKTVKPGLMDIPIPMLSRSHLKKQPPRMLIPSLYDQPVHGVIGIRDDQE